MQIEIIISTYLKFIQEIYSYLKFIQDASSLFQKRFGDRQALMHAVKFHELRPCLHLRNVLTDLNSSKRHAFTLSFIQIKVCKRN